MAHKKGEGSVKNGRDSNSKRLGVKIYGGQPVIAGNIIVRLRGVYCLRFRDLLFWCCAGGWYMQLALVFSCGILSRALE